MKGAVFRKTTPFYSILHFFFKLWIFQYFFLDFTKYFFRNFSSFSINFNTIIWEIHLPWQFKLFIKLSYVHFIQSIHWISKVDFIFFMERSKDKWILSARSLCTVNELFYFIFIDIEICFFFVIKHEKIQFFYVLF